MGKEPITVLCLYHNSEINRTLNYQYTFVKELKKSDYFELTSVNLASSKYIICLKIAYFLLIRKKLKAIILLHSVYSNHCYAANFIKKFLKGTRIPKIVFLSNEYKLIPQKIDFINEIRSNLVFTQTDSKKVKDLYASKIAAKIYTCPNTIINSVDFKLENDWEVRPIDIGYRSYHSPPYLVHSEREDISHYFIEFAKRTGLTADISINESSRLEGSKYLEFLRQCKFQIGTEAGFDFFDIDDTVRLKTNQLLLKGRSACSLIRDYHKNLKAEDYVQMRIISGRHIEASLCGSIQILFEGWYSGYLKPDIHYISVKKDFSNMDKVVYKMSDYNYLAKLRKNAFEMAIKNFDSEVISELLFRNIKKHI